MLATQFQELTLFVQSIGLLSLILVFWQIRNSNKWKRLEFTMDEQWQQKILQGSCKIDEISEKKGFIRNIKEPISIEDAKIIIADDDLYNCLSDYLNNLEEISLMCNIGAMHNKYAYSKFSANIIFAYEYYHNFISQTRIHENDNLIFIEIQRLYRKWKLIEENEIKRDCKLQDQFERKREKIQAK